MTHPLLAEFPLPDTDAVQRFSTNIIWTVHEDDTNQAPGEVTWSRPQDRPYQAEDFIRTKIYNQNLEGDPYWWIGEQVLGFNLAFSSEHWGDWAVVEVRENGKHICSQYPDEEYVFVEGPWGSILIDTLPQVLPF